LAIEQINKKIAGLDEEVLKHTGYIMTKTAEMLQIDRKTLYNKMKAFGIDI